jgi:hypothetical protein
MIEKGLVVKHGNGRCYRIRQFHMLLVILIFHLGLLRH